MSAARGGGNRVPVYTTNLFIGPSAGRRQLDGRSHPPDADEVRV